MAERTYDGVIPLVASQRGWEYWQIRFTYDPSIHLSGDPADINRRTPVLFQTSLDAAYQHTLDNRPDDTNDPKNALGSLKVAGGILEVHTVSSNYHTIRGISHTDPDLHKIALLDLKSQQATQIPIGISTHNVLVIQDHYAALTVASPVHGFAPGRLSLTLEEQMDPDKDLIPYNTAYRGFREELGVRIPLNVRLLGVAAEKRSAYTSWCFVGSTPENPATVVEAWKTATDRNEASALLIVPIDELGGIFLPNTQGEALQKYIVGGSVEPERQIKLHDTTLWRFGCLRGYLST